MPDANYQVNPKPLRELLHEAGDGRVQLPDFQRGWVWNDKRIRSLLASISLSYPVGAVMMLETGGSIRFKPRSLEGAPDSTEEAAQRLILDGQQRLTSLFQSLLSDKPVETPGRGKKTIRRWYYIDMKKAIEGEEADREDAILSIPEDKRLRSSKNVIEADYSTAELEYQNMVFPLKDIFNSYAWANGFRKHWNQDQDKLRLWDTFHNSIVRNFDLYEIHVFSLGKNTPPAAVCQVFEKLNTGGVALTVFELLTARFAIDGFKLGEDWEARKQQLKNIGGVKSPVLGKVSNTDFLQAVTLLATRKRQAAISCKRADMLKLELEEYQEWADPLMDGFKWAASFLALQNVRDAKFLPYRSQLIPLAAILTVLKKEMLTPSERKKLAQWYWCGVFGELYAGTPATRFAQDLPDVVEWMRGGDTIPRTVDNALFRSRRLLSLQSLRSAAYKGVHSLILRGNPCDWSTGLKMEHFNEFDYAVDIHHIFPQKWCSDRKIDKDKCNSIVNKTPLYAPTNRKLGANAPSEYTSAIEKDEENDEAKLDERLKSHFIDPNLLRADKFNDFFNARHRKLVEQIEQAMGKDAVWDDDEGEELPDDDDDEVIDEDE